ncbi:MAG: cysteine-rich CWC family protein [Burkholderiales bacterium]|nr:cysteine-rich CWC family protein [Burkholderiales bacterium]
MTKTSAPPEAGTPSACARCGRNFTCAMAAGRERCWCVELPPLEPIPGSGCLCPDCLRAALAAQGGRGAAIP